MSFSSENREKTLRFVLTFHGQATDKLPTGYRHITNSRPTVGRLSADCRPTGSLYFRQNLVKKSSPKNLSADRRPTVGRLSADCRPSVGRLSAVCRPTGFLGSSSSQLPKIEPQHPQFPPFFFFLKLNFLGSSCTINLLRSLF